MLEDLEERAELSLARTFGSSLRIGVRGGVLALERLGGATVSGSLLGQSLNFAAPGKGTVDGAYGGADVDLRLGDRWSVFLSGDYTAADDLSSLVTAQAGCAGNSKRIPRLKRRAVHSSRRRLRRRVTVRNPSAS